MDVLGGINTTSIRSVNIITETATITTNTNSVPGQIWTAVDSAGNGSWQNGGGGGATPAGVPTQLQYNLNGTDLGAVAGSSVSGGQITVTGFRLNDGNQGNGKVLTSDATGISSWTTPSPSGITALTGEVTATGPGSVAATLSTTGVSAATYGSSSTVGQFAVDTKGRLTSATDIPLNLVNMQDVNVSTPTNNQVLTYNTGSSKWQNQATTLDGLKVIDASGVFVTGQTSIPNVPGATSSNFSTVMIGDVTTTFNANIGGGVNIGTGNTASYDQPVTNVTIVGRDNTVNTVNIVNDAVNTTIVGSENTFTSDGLCERIIIVGNQNHIGDTDVSFQNADSVIMGNNLTVHHPLRSVVMGNGFNENFAVEKVWIGTNLGGGTLGPDCSIFLGTNVGNHGFNICVGVANNATTQSAPYIFGNFNSSPSTGSTGFKPPFIIGENNVCNGGNGQVLIIGQGNSADSSNPYAGITIGHANLASSGIAIGRSCFALGANSGSFGYNNNVTGSSSFAFGQNNTTPGNQCFSFGNNNSLTVLRNFAFGSNCNDNGFTGVHLFGFGSVALNDFSLGFEPSMLNTGTLAPVAAPNTPYLSVNVGGVPYAIELKTIV